MRRVDISADRPSTEEVEQQPLSFNISKQTCGNFSERDKQALCYESRHVTKMTTAAYRNARLDTSAVFKVMTLSRLSTNGNFPFLEKRAIRFFLEKKAFSLLHAGSLCSSP